MYLLTKLLTLYKTSPWQPHSNGNKCHTLAHFPPLNLLLVHGIGQIQLEARVPGSSMFSLSRHRVDKDGEWIWRGK